MRGFFFCFDAKERKAEFAVNDSGVRIYDLNSSADRVFCPLMINHGTSDLETFRIKLDTIQENVVFALGQKFYYNNEIISVFNIYYDDRNNSVLLDCIDAELFIMISRHDIKIVNSNVKDLYGDRVLRAISLEEMYSHVQRLSYRN